MTPPTGTSCRTGGSPGMRAAGGTTPCWSPCWASPPSVSSARARLLGRSGEALGPQPGASSRPLGCSVVSSEHPWQRRGKGRFSHAEFNPCLVSSSLESSCRRAGIQCAREPKGDKPESCWCVPVYWAWKILNAVPMSETSRFFPHNFYFPCLIQAVHVWAIKD